MGGVRCADADSQLRWTVNDIKMRPSSLPSAESLAVVATAAVALAAWVALRRRAATRAPAVVRVGVGVMVRRADGLKLIAYGGDASRFPPQLFDVKVAHLVRDDLCPATRTALPRTRESLSLPTRPPLSPKNETSENDAN